MRIPVQQAVNAAGTASFVAWLHSSAPRPTMATNTAGLFLAGCLASAVLLLAMSAPTVSAHRDLKKNEDRNSLCDNILSTYTTKQGDTARSIVKSTYPSSNANWKKLWGLVKACNKAALPGAHVGIGRANKLQPGISLTMPAIKDTLLKTEDPVLNTLCGCTPAITVEQPSTWLEIATAAYPGDQPVGVIANLLTMCNGGATIVEGSDGKLLAAGQKLRGACTTLKGQSLQQILDTARVRMETMAGQPALEALTAPGAVSIAAVGGTCAIAVSGAGPLRSVTLSNSCPVYTNGCSGPSDLLGYQQQLTPGCQAHDWCYSCGHILSPAANKDMCDTRFLANLNGLCEYHYGDWNPARAACKANAQTMYLAVVAVDDSWYTYDTCPGESYKLAYTDFGFNPLYLPSGVKSYMRPGNGQQWGSWTNFAQCPTGSYASGFQARVEPYRGTWRDDTALNAVRVRCTDRTGAEKAIDLRPHDGFWGTWGGYSNCPAGKHIVGVRMWVEATQPWGIDDTAVQTLRLLCSDGTQISHPSSGYSCPSCSWSPSTANTFVQCPPLTYVCAFKIKIENSGAADPTAMNDIELACCD